MQSLRLWGGQGDDDGGRASQVFLKVQNVSKPKVERWAEYRPNAKITDTIYPERWANLLLCIISCSRSYTGKSA